MATATVAIERQISGAQASERRFYTRMAWFMIATVFAGFSASFYLRGLVTFPRPNPTLNPLVYVHGGVFTLWMLVFLAQARLIAAGRRRTHMSLGIAGMLLGVAMLVLMFLVATAQVARANQPPVVTPLAWLAVPLFGIPVFALFIAMGWRYRRQAQVHKRFMLLAALMMMEPAIARLPLMPPSLTSQYVMALLGWSTVVPLMIRDRRTLGHLHWATQLGAAAMAAALILRFALWQTPGWASLAAKIVAFAN
jgi:hypothetical protein